MKLLVGLGNPGNKYRNTRHNVGFMILDSYAKSRGLKFKHNNKSEVAIGDQLILLKPLTFMNNSGSEVKRVMNYYKISPADVLVIHDDKDLLFGNFKIKFDSSSGGHNGVQDIISQLKTQKFSRLKIGIDSDYNRDTVDFVLSNFSKEEITYLDDNNKKYTGILNDFIEFDISTVMNRYNGGQNDI